MIFTNTLFNCLATVDDDHNFRPLWRPSHRNRHHRVTAVAIVHWQTRFPKLGF